MRLVVDVIVAERSGQAGGLHEAVKVVDTRHVGHDT